MRVAFGVLFTGLVALTAGVIGFQAGVASNIAASGGVVWLGGGIPGLGFLFFLFFVGFLFFAIGGRRRAWARGPMGGRGGWGGHGTWENGDPRRQWVAEAHRRLHEEDAAGTSAGGPTTGSGPSTEPSTAG